jgi:hypothetical protein
LGKKIPASARAIINKIRVEACLKCFMVIHPMVEVEVVLSLTDFES